MPEFHSGPYLCLPTVTHKSIGARRKGRLLLPVMIIRPSASGGVRLRPAPTSCDGRLTALSSAGASTSGGRSACCRSHGARVFSDEPRPACRERDDHQSVVGESVRRG